MCVIVDTNAFAAVFNANANNHDEFAPVLDWIISGKGKLVIGGTKYMSELARTKKYLSFVQILNTKARKVIRLNDSDVDAWQNIIEDKIKNPDFDDPHLPAIVIVSKCRVICSVDIRSVRFVTDSNIYPKGIVVPKYYTSKKNANLLTDEYVHKCYRPLTKLSKQVKTILTGALDKIKD